MLRTMYEPTTTTIYLISARLTGIENHLSEFHLTFLFRNDFTFVILVVSPVMLV